jgi:hypothetical protein
VGRNLTPSTKLGAKTRRNLDKLAGTESARPCMAQAKHGANLAHPTLAMETVGRRCWPEDGWKSKWGRKHLCDQDVLRGSPPVSEDDSWEEDMAAASSRDAKFAEDVEEKLQNVYEPAWPLVMPGIKLPPGYPAFVTAAKGAEMHNLWHPSQFTKEEAGYVTCTLCALRIFCGQEAMHGRGRRHSVKAFHAGKKPIAQCRGFKWCCWYGCSCRRLHIRIDSCR